jgi:hypothetical protein
VGRSGALARCRSPNIKRLVISVNWRTDATAIPAAQRPVYSRLDVPGSKERPKVGRSLRTQRKLELRRWIGDENRVAIGNEIVVEIGGKRRPRG